MAGTLPQKSVSYIVNQVGFYPQAAGFGPAEFLGVPGPFFADGRAPVEVDFPLRALSPIDAVGNHVAGGVDDIKFLGMTLHMAVGMPVDRREGIRLAAKCRHDMAGVVAVDSQFEIKTSRFRFLCRKGIFNIGKVSFRQ